MDASADRIASMVQNESVYNAMLNEPVFRNDSIPEHRIGVPRITEWQKSVQRKFIEACVE